MTVLLQVALINVLRQPATEWDAYFPDFAKWSQLRLESLRTNPSDWPESLVKKATAASKATAGAGCEDTSSSAAERSQKQAAPWSLSKLATAAELGLSSTGPSDRMRRSRSRTAVDVILEEEQEAVALDCVEVDSSSSTGRRRRRIRNNIRTNDGHSLPVLVPATAVRAAQVCTAAVGMPSSNSSNSLGCVDRDAGLMSVLQPSPSPQQQRRQSEQQLAEQQHVKQIQSLQQDLLQDAYAGGLIKSAGERHSRQKAAIGRAWLSASVRPDQQLHQQQSSLAATMDTAGTQQHAWQWQQQQLLGDSDHGIGRSSSSSSPCIQGLVPTFVALQETGTWAAYRFSPSNSSREEHILSLSELLRQRSQQLAFDRVGWQAVATCG